MFDSNSIPLRRPATLDANDIMPFGSHDHPPPRPQGIEPNAPFELAPDHFADRMLPDRPHELAVLLAILYLFIKAIATVGATRLIRPTLPGGRLTAVLGGWLLVQVAQDLLIMVLSAGNALNPAVYSLLTLFLTTGLWWLTHRRLPSLAALTALPRSARIAVVALMVPIATMTVRAAFLSDLTWDGQVYELPRLVIWLNQGTIFVDMPAIQRNLFINEWNGELNALAFALFAGGYAGFAFANVEVLLVTGLAAAWLGRSLGLGRAASLWLAALLTSTPAMIGLASTVKGDLLACAGVLLSAGWLCQLWRSDRPLPAIAWLVLTAALAFGAKVSAAGALAAVFGFAGLKLVRQHWCPHPPKQVALATLLAAGSLTFLARFIANWTMLGNPLQRVGGESAQFALSHLGDNLALTANRLFAGWELTTHATWALSASMGTAVWVLLAGAMAGRRRALTARDTAVPAGRSSTPGLTLALGIAVAASAAALMLALPAYPWNFRYFAPGILVALVCVAALSTPSTAIRRRWLLPVVAAGIASNLWLGTRPGDIFPTALPTTSGRAGMLPQTPLQRLSRAFDSVYRQAAIEALGLDEQQSRSLIILQGANTALLPFLGSHAQNRIRLVSTKRELVIAAGQAPADAIVIALPKPHRPPRIVARLHSLGYSVVVDGDHYLVAVPGAALRERSDAPLAELRWGHLPLGGTGDEPTDANLPAIESKTPVDSALVTQEFAAPPLLRVRAAFAGEVDGPGEHAAHLSFHGQGPIFFLPPGRYDERQVFETILPAPAPGRPTRLSFGLGGWAQGSGHIRLVRLELAGLSIAHAERPQ